MVKVTLKKRHFNSACIYKAVSTSDYTFYTHAGANDQRRPCNFYTKVFSYQTTLNVVGRTGG